MQIFIRHANENDLDTVYKFMCLLSDKMYDRQVFEEMYLQNLQSDKKGNPPEDGIAKMVKMAQDMIPQYK